MRGRGVKLQTSSKVFRGWFKSGRCKVAAGTKGKMCGLTTTTDFDINYFLSFLCSHS